MELAFLNRRDEKTRLTRLFSAREGTFACVYGRRRCGKSRLLLEVMKRKKAVYHVADERNAPLQRQSVATAIAARIPGFDEVEYPDWERLLARWFREASQRSILVLDELPYLVATSPELPSILQNLIDQHRHRRLHLIVCGSSQRMMQGLILDAKAPLYGRAQEIIKISPLPAGWIRKALQLDNARQALEAWSIWGGIPRYWELAADYPDLWQAVQNLVLDPMGVLHHEPTRLLLDDMRETTQTASILSLIGSGCHRISEIGGRLGQPATALARPIQRLQELGLVNREVPFRSSPRSGKLSSYSIADPFLRFWFRYVEPNRSRLEARQLTQTASHIQESFPTYLGRSWEELARTVVARLEKGQRWLPALRWWGNALDRKRMELDILAESIDGQTLLAGEAKLSVAQSEWKQRCDELHAKVARLPFAGKYRQVVPALFVAEGKPIRGGKVQWVSADDVLSALK
jgi:hypothetical protein